MGSKVNEKHVEHIKSMIVINVKKDYDLEVIWLLYVLIETNNIVKDDSVVNIILESDNEIAKIMLLRKNLISNVEIIKQEAKSWILNYELFASDFIDIDELCEIIPLNRNKIIYEKLKEQDLHFCY